MGTLKSTRITTRLPLRAKSLIESFAIFVILWNFFSWSGFFSIFIWFLKLFSSSFNGFISEAHASVWLLHNRLQSQGECYTTLILKRVRFSTKEEKFFQTCNFWERSVQNYFQSKFQPVIRLQSIQIVWKRGSRSLGGREALRWVWRIRSCPRKCPKRGFSWEQRAKITS